MHQIVFFYFKLQHLLKHHDRRRHTVHDLPWELFPVILRISDRVTPSIIHHARLPIHSPPSLSNSHKLCARPAISAAEIWDACNYRAIYSNQLDPNLYFPEAPAGLLASSYLPGRCSAPFCFLIRFGLELFQQGRERRSSCDSGFQKVKGSKIVNTDRPANSNGAQCGSSTRDVLFNY